MHTHTHKRITRYAASKEIRIDVRYMMNMIIIITNKNA